MVAFKNREHVLPQSFGLFRDNLTLLETVCDACNSYFDQELDRYLARDTLDGLSRFLFGLKPPDEYKSAGVKSTLVHRVGEGPLLGAVVRMKPMPTGLQQVPIPQVGLGKSPDGPFTWFPVDALPSAQELRRQVDSGCTHIRFIEIEDIEPVLAYFRQCGLKDVAITPAQSPNGRLRMETLSVVGLRFRRAIAKVAFNYLTYEFGATFARLPQFDEIRRFIRNDVKPSWLKWTAEPGPSAGGKPFRMGHLVGVKSDGAQVVGYVCLNSYYKYAVSLAVGGFLISHEMVSAHFFDLNPDGPRVDRIEPALARRLLA